MPQATLTGGARGHALQPLTIYPERDRPAHVQRIERPVALGRAVALALLRWEKRNLAPTERFWRDFGMSIVESNADRVVARGAAGAPCIAVATRGKQDRYVGAAFAMAEDTDLRAYANEPGARTLRADEVAGGGEGIELIDPAGRPVWLLKRRPLLAPLPARQPLAPQMNTAAATPRVNRMVRTPVEPALVVKLGHVVMQTVDLPRMLDWYMRMLGLLPTDVHYLADGSPMITFLRFNLGNAPADHHSVVLVGGIEEKYEHSAYEVIDLDDIGQGQQVLRAAGHSHVWGIGRHLIGSQLFDYWQDPDGFQHEHYTDGDVFTADFETQYSPMGTGAIWAWGTDVPPAMLPRKNLRTLVQVLRLLWRKQLSPQRLKLVDAALGSPARPWL